MVFVRPFAPPCPSAASAPVPHSFMSHAFSPPDILLILGELRAEVRQLGEDLTYLRALVEERLPAPCVPVPRAASPSAQPQRAVPSVPVPRAAASSVPVFLSLCWCSARVLCARSSGCRSQCARSTGPFLRRQLLRSRQPSRLHVCARSSSSCQFSARLRSGG